MDDVHLIPPTTLLQASWLASWDEWGRTVHQDGSSMVTAERANLDLEDPEDFRAWVDLLLSDADPEAERPGDRVPATNLWVVRGQEYLGSIQLRHRLNPFLAELGGHIGYGIRPRDRGRGLATFALAEMLSRARSLGLDRVLLTCDDTNVASASVIERNGGVLQDVRPVDAYAREHGFEHPLRRYWITL